MNDTTRDDAHAVAAEIVNLLAGDHPGGKAALYYDILWLIFDCLGRAQEERFECMTESSEN